MQKARVTVTVRREILAKAEREVKRGKARSVSAWDRICRQPEVVQTLGSGECLHEVPFSLALPERREVVRGSIDCLVVRADGSVSVVEFKTGRRRDEHEAQLEWYVRAAQAMFPDALVDGRLVYA